jgi:competence protein ComEC
MDPPQGGVPKGRVRLHRAPLAPVAAAMILGIVAGRYLPLPMGLWAVVGGAALATAAMGLWRPHLHLLSIAAILVAVAAFGAVNVGLDYFAAADNDILTYTGPSDILATLRGRIVSSPAICQDDPPPAYGYRRSPQTQFILRARQLRTKDGWLPVSGQVAVSIHQADDRLAPGQQVEVMGWLGRVRGPDNPGQYDWSAAARRNSTPVRMAAPGVESVSVLDDGPRSWAARAYWQVRTAARRHLAYGGDEQTSQLINALIIGDRSPALRTLSRTMMRAGVVHYLSISGSHLAIFLGFVYLLCRVLTLSPRRAAIVVLAVLAAYMILAEARAPLVRSAVMAAALCLATIAGRPHAALNALAAATVGVLAAAPMDVFDPGFQLSFGIVAASLAFFGPVKSMLFGRWLAVRGLKVFRDEDRLRRWWNYNAAEWGMNAVVIALIAYVVSAPLVAYHFHFFSPYAAPLSLLLGPFVTAVLVPGYISLALAWPMPNLAYSFSQLAAAAADGLAWAVGAMERLPGLSFDLRDVSVGWVLLCYATMAAILAARRIRFGRVLVAVAVVALAAATVYSQRTSPPTGRAELNVLSVGAGQCVVLRTPSGKTFLFDAGTRSGFDAYEQVLGPFLRHQRLPDPTVAFISHANVDHFNALAGALGRRRLQRVFVNEVFGIAAGGESEAFGSDWRFLADVQKAGVTVVRLSAGQIVKLDDRTSVEVLWPPPGRGGLSANESSLVLRISCDGASVLLPADVEAVGQETLASAKAVKADVLMLPHHGSWRPGVEDFVQAVAPKVVLVSSAREPYGPVALEEPAEFYDRLRTAYRYLSTPRHGWIHVRFGGGPVEVQTMR